MCAAKHLQVYCERPHSEINESKKVLVWHIEGQISRLQQVVNEVTKRFAREFDITEIQKFGWDRHEKSTLWLLMATWPGTIQTESTECLLSQVQGQERNQTYLYSSTHLQCILNCKYSCTNPLY